MMEFTWDRHESDGDEFNQGRSEGRADVAAALRKILDPLDRNHWSLDGLLWEVERLKKRTDRCNYCED